MRVNLNLSVSALALSLFVVGCSPAKYTGADDTANRTPTGAALNYPAGPYGYTEGQIMQNIDFVGKSDPNGAAGTADYEALPMQKVSLADFYGKSDVKLILLTGAAGWCYYCNEEAKDVPDLQNTFEPQGVRFITGLVQGYNERSGAPASEADLVRWQNAHDVHVTMALDPQAKLQQYADVSAFPLNMLIRTSDMQIVYMAVGYGGSLTNTIQQHLN